MRKRERRRWAPAQPSLPNSSRCVVYRGGAAYERLLRFRGKRAKKREGKKGKKDIFLVCWADKNRGGGWGEKKTRLGAQMRGERRKN